jgi:hypothetical protein
VAGGKVDTDDYDKKVEATSERPTQVTSDYRGTVPSQESITDPVTTEKAPRAKAAVLPSTKLVVDTQPKATPYPVGFKRLRDESDIAEAVSKAVSKAVVEGALVEEVFAALVDYARGITDLTTLAEVFAKHLDKSIVESVSVSEVFEAVGDGEFHQDSAAVAESGYAVRQDYVDGDYFLEDYVGTVHTIV